jgi:macrolide transport system ATP-binding/permease protein
MSLTSLARLQTQLTLHEVTKTVDRHVVLDRVTCSFGQDAVTGVIGENGSGKSTLLRLLAGLDGPEAGRVVVQAPGGLALLAQQSPTPQSLTVGEVIDLGLTDLRAIGARMRAIEEELAVADQPESIDAGMLEGALTEYGDLQAQFDLRDGFDAEARLHRALAGLGLVHLPSDRRLDQMSGGEQARLHLAALLASSPEVLLLDEPTNHLDVRATQWLEAHLTARRGTTVVVSHDRVFLDQVSDTLLEVDGDTHRVARFAGGYDGYLAAKAADRAGGRVQASESSRVRRLRQRLRRLEDDPVPIPPAQLGFTATLSGGRPRTTAIHAVDVGITGRLAPTSLLLAGNGRLLVTGPNGAGKSSLLSALAGTVVPDRGTVFRQGRIAHLPQEARLDRSQSALQAFGAGRGGTADEHDAQLRGLGLLPADRLRAPVATLSSGQRRRLALARLVAEPADVLLLDEPFNHVSLSLVEELEEALTGFAGAVVIVTHDRLFQQLWTGDVIHLPGPATHD